MSCGGLSVLERCLRVEAKRGVRRAIIPATPIPMRPDVPVAIEWAAPGSAPPEGVPIIHGNVVAGVPIRDRATIRQAERALIAELGKSHEGPVDQLFNSIFSRPITRLLMRTPIRPNHITIFATLLGLAGAVCLLGANHKAYALGGYFTALSLLSAAPKIISY